MAVILQERVSEEIEWALKETPRESGSCLQLGNDGQCVNKATSLLTSLQDQLLKWRTTKEVTSSRTRRKKTIPSPILKDNMADSIQVNNVDKHSTVMSDNKELVVLGSQTGHTRFKTHTGFLLGTSNIDDVTSKSFDWAEIDDVIMRTLNLVLRLEEDRSETVRLLEEEREKVRVMRETLDIKAAERLRILPALVQKEHEQCLHDLLELKWHVSFEGRQLNRIHDDVQIVVDKNNQLKEEVDGIKNQLPLLQEKLQTQGDQMAAIAHRQTDTTEELAKKRDDLSKIREKAHQTKVRVTNEIRQMDKTLQELKNRLEITQAVLTKAQNDRDTISGKITGAQRKCIENEKVKSFKDEELRKMKENKKEIETRVNALKQQTAQLEEDIDHLEERNAHLRVRKKDQYASHDTEHTLINAEIQKKTKELRDGRERNKNMLDEIEEMKEQIITSRKQAQDAVKSIERTCKELQKVDKQLEVVYKQTDIVRQEHRELSHTLKEEEDKTAHVEHTLKNTVQILKEELQKETKTKILYQGKIKADGAELEKMKAEHKYNQEKVRKLAKEKELKRQQEKDTVRMLEEQCIEKKLEEAKLREDSNNVLQELTSIERELRDKINALTPKETQLRAEATEKGVRVKQVRERVNLLSERIKDLHTSLDTVKRMSHNTTSTIEQLEVQRDDLQAKITVEEEEEESWKRELEEITNFSKTAEEKYTNYVQIREAYFNQLETDAYTAAHENRALASEYESLRERHVQVKTKALRALEHQLDLEAAIKDMGQLLALQSKLNSTMKAHYEHRGASSRRDLARFKSHICKTQDKIADLETQFKLVISNVDSFLKSHTQEQDEIITRHRQKEEIQEKEKDFPNVENEKVDTLVVERQDEDSPDISKDAGILKDKSVSFLLPIKCSS